MRPVSFLQRPLDANSRGSTDPRRIEGSDRSRISRNEHLCEAIQIPKRFAHEKYADIVECVDELEIGEVDDWFEDK